LKKQLEKAIVKLEKAADRRVLHSAMPFILVLCMIGSSTVISVLESSLPQVQKQVLDLFGAFLWPFGHNLVVACEIEVQKDKLTKVLS